MKRIVVPLLLALILSFSALAQEGSTAKVPEGSKVFIAEMQGGLHTFIAAEIVKKKVPVTVVTEESAADFILTGGSIRADDKWYHTVFGGKDKNEGSVQMISVKDKVMVWAGEAGDRSLLWAAGLAADSERSLTG